MYCRDFYLYVIFLAFLIGFDFLGGLSLNDLMVI